MENEPQSEETLDSIRMHGRSLQEWYDWLLIDHETGQDVSMRMCPGSRYGRYTKDVAMYAVACEWVYVDVCGEDDDPEVALEHYMGVVVNNQPGAADLLVDYWTRLPKALQTEFGSIKDMVLKKIGRKPSPKPPRPPRPRRPGA